MLDKVITMVKLMRRVTQYFVTLIKISMHIIEYNTEHICLINWMHKMDLTRQKK